MVLKEPWPQKRVLWVLEKSIFCFFFANFSLKKLKPFVGKERQNIQSYLNQSLAIGSFLENSFEAILSSKTSVVIVWKEHFSVFCKFLSDEVETLTSKANFLSTWKEHFLVFGKLLSDEVETILWESEAKCSTLFKSEFGHRKLLRKSFWRYLQLKKECSEHLKRVFCGFL